MPALPLAGGPLMLKKHTAHLVQVAGDNGVQAWLCAAPAACGDDGDATPCPLRSELVAGELGGQLAQFHWQVRRRCHCASFPPLRLTSCIRPNGHASPRPGRCSRECARTNRAFLKYASVL